MKTKKKESDMATSGSKTPASSIIRLFRLKGVNGYKDLEFQSKNAVRIMAAENGAGKTTLLSSLYAILSGNLKALLNVDFESFELDVNGTTWQKKRTDFAAYSAAGKESIGQTLSMSRFGFPKPTDREIEETIQLVAEGNDDALQSSSYFLRVANEQHIPLSIIKSALSSWRDDEVLELAKAGREAFSTFYKEVSDALGACTVLYLPTYRRIEAVLPDYVTKRDSVRTRRGERGEWRTSQLMYFGLQDVEARLESISEDIRRSTLASFSSINGRTLDDLLSGNYQRSAEISTAIDLSVLQVVLGRVGRDNSATSKRLEELITTGKINERDNIYLKSFLIRLLETYRATQEREASIERFIGVINSYWKGDLNEKLFVFDKNAVEARVLNTYTGLPLPLSALSSGEKQIISVFARLYLEDSASTILLIDEPELSLSMEWQAKFLPDIYRAPNCAQIIAITHSPFIFQNELRRFAGPLKVKLHKKTQVQG